MFPVTSPCTQAVQLTLFIFASSFSLSLPCEYMCVVGERERERESFLSHDNALEEVIYRSVPPPSGCRRWHQWFAGIRRCRSFINFRRQLLPVHSAWVAVWPVKFAKCLWKLPKNDFTSKMKNSTTLQKLTKNVGDLGKIIVAQSFVKLPKVQYIAQSSHTE